MFLPRPRKPEGALEERAVRWAIRNPDMTYVQVAALFGVTANNIRARIEYRYGSRELATHYAFEDEPPNTADKRCLVCWKPDTVEQGTYICQTCKEDSL
jgi:hypothetical protein